VKQLTQPFNFESEWRGETIAGLMPYGNNSKMEELALLKTPAKKVAAPCIPIMRSARENAAMIWRGSTELNSSSLISTNLSIPSVF
jgi:hypothetical protein